MATVVRTRPGTVPAGQLERGDLVLRDPRSWYDHGRIDVLRAQAFDSERRVRGVTPSGAGPDLVDVHTSACTWVGVAADEMVLVDRAPPVPTAEEWATATADLVCVARRIICDIPPRYLEEIMTKRPGKVELYERADGRWSWRHRASNGPIDEGPGQGFSSKGNAKRSAKTRLPGVPIVEA